MKTPIRFLAVVCLLAGILFAQDSMYLRWVEVSDVSLSVEKSCGQYEFAAAVQAIAAKLGARIPQAAILKQVYGGTNCGPVGDPAALAPKLGGSYELPDGSSVSLSASYSGGGPGTADAVVVPLSQGRPYIMFWKKRPMVVIAVGYNRTDQNGNLLQYDDSRGYPVIQVVRMLDPKTGGIIEWRRGTDNIGDLRGTMQVIISKR